MTGSEAAPSDERQTKNSLIFFKKILEISVMTWTFVEYFGIFYIILKSSTKIVGKNHKTVLYKFCFDLKIEQHQIFIVFLIVFKL